MNQILYVEGKKKNQPADIKKVILFFSVAMIILGVILVGQGSYAMISNSKQNDNKQIAKETVPQVEVTKEENEDGIIIKISHDKAISKIIYQWNAEEQQEISGENRSNFSEIIDLPFGTNMLNLTVIDINGKETKYQKEYIVDGDGKPVINLTLTSDNKIKITAQDAKSLKYIIYTWNNTQETKVEANTENMKLIERELEIPYGQNTLKVEAVNQNDVITTKELDVKGVKSPKVTLSREGENLIIKAEDETQIERIEYSINGGETNKIDVAARNFTSLEYKRKLDPGENKVIVRVYNKDGGMTEKKVRTVL